MPADGSTIEFRNSHTTLAIQDGGFFSLDDLPVKCHIDVIQDDRQTAILKITGGGPRSTSLLIFAVVWNAIVWPVFIIF
ncbi:MAG: hypothetical protein ABGZ35_30200, partial [Planctomycetaceae bacterium]